MVIFRINQDFLKQVLVEQFSARSYNRLSHADEILLDPSFLLGTCTAPYLAEKQEGLLSQI